MIETTVNFVGESSPNSTYGKGLIGAWVLVYLGLAVSDPYGVIASLFSLTTAFKASTALYEYQLFRFITRLRGGLTALVYERALDIRAADSEDITAVALMGTDIPRIVQSFRAIHEIWATILDISIAVWLLERQLSIACVAPVVVSISTFGNKE